MKLQGKWFIKQGNGVSVYPKLMMTKKVLAGSVALLSILASIGIVTGLVSPKQAYGDEKPGCFYAEPGTGKYANTICWIDFENVDSDQTDSAEGQSIAINLGDGYSATMTIRTSQPTESDFPEAQSSPNWSGIKPYAPTKAYSLPGVQPNNGAVRKDFGFGNSANGYNGIGGKPFMWNIPTEGGPSASSFKLMISDIDVVGPHQQRPSFGLVAADAEDTQRGEFNSFQSDKTLTLLDQVNPHSDDELADPNSGVHGSFQQRVKYNSDRTVANIEGLSNGNSQGLPSSNLLFAAASPKWISQAYNGDSRNGSTYGFMLARNQVSTKIVGGDGQLTSSITGEDKASQNKTDAAVEAGSNGSIRLQDSNTAVVGDWSQVVDTSSQAGDENWTEGYDKTWSCEKNGTAADSIIKTNNGSEISLDDSKLTPYDFVHCTVTYTAKFGSLSWKKVDATTGNPLAGTTWEITAPDGSTRTVEDNDAQDTDPTVGTLSVPSVAAANGAALWGNYSVKEVGAPAGYSLSEKVLTAHLSSSHLNWTADELGTVEDTRLAGSVSWNKVDGSSGAALAGSVWTLTGPDGKASTVTDNGAGDVDDVAGALKVSGLAWGEYTLQEKTAPAGYQLDTTPHKFTLQIDNLDVELGTIANSKAVTPTPPQPHINPTPGQLPTTGSDVGIAAVAFTLLLGLGTVILVEKKRSRMHK